MKRLLLISFLFSLVAFTSKAQWLPCVDNGLMSAATCSVVDSVYGCTGLMYNCADDAMYNHGVTHYTHDPNPNFNVYPCHSDFTINEFMGVWSFNDSSSWAGGPNPSCAWSFGDGNSNTDYLSTSHTYSSSGYQVVTLTIDDGLCASTTSRVILVAGGGGCNALFSASTNCGITTFTDLSTGTGYTAGWDFGDGTTLSNQAPGNQTYNYAASGTYVVHLAITDGTGSCNSAFTLNVTVDLPTVNANFSGAVTGNHTVTFTNTSTGAASYMWDLGDGDTTSAANPTHTYTGCQYSVVLFATDSNNCTNTDTLSVDACAGGVNFVNNSIQSISIYPNPAKDNLNVLLNSRKAVDVELTMKDVTGRSVIEPKSIHLNSGKTNYKLELPVLPAGIYLIQVTNGNEITNSRVLIR